MWRSCMRATSCGQQILLGRRHSQCTGACWRLQAFLQLHDVGDCKHLYGASRGASRVLKHARGQTTNRQSSTKVSPFCTAFRGTVQTVRLQPTSNGQKSNPRRENASGRAPTLATSLPRPRRRVGAGTPRTSAPTPSSVRSRIAAPAAQSSGFRPSLAS